MVDSFAMIIATNVAAKIAGILTDQAQQGVTAIVQKIREKIRSRPGGPGEIAALDAVIATGDVRAAEALAQVLEDLFAMDPQFREEIRMLWDSSSSDDHVTNVFSGQAAKVIMMRDVNGDLTIN